MSDAVNITRGWGLLEGLLARERANKANALISKAFRQGKILDIGCGSFPYFLTTINFKQKYGVDPSLNSLSVDDINLQRLDVAKQKLPFKNAFFDVVTMLAVFEHIEHKDLMPVIKGIYRILKKGGLLIITTPAPWSDKLLHQMAMMSLSRAFGSPRTLAMDRSTLARLIPRPTVRLA